MARTVLHAPGASRGRDGSVTGSLHANAATEPGRPARGTLYAVAPSAGADRAGPRPVRGMIPSATAVARPRLPCPRRLRLLVLDAARAPRPASPTARRATTTPAAPAGAAGARGRRARRRRASAAAFPAAHGRTLHQLGEAGQGRALQLGAATGTFTPGTRRFAFALDRPARAASSMPPRPSTSPAAPAPRPRARSWLPPIR